VNVSALQFDRDNGGYVNRLMDTLDCHNLPASRLELELTETEKDRQR